MGEWANGFPGGGTNIKGVIKRYPALANVAIGAGDFVEYAVNPMDNPADSQLVTSNNTGEELAAIALSDDRVLMLYSVGTTIDYLRASVVKKTDSLFAVGAVVEIGGAYSGQAKPAICIIDKNRVLVVYQYSNSRLVHASVLTITDMIIAVGTSTVIYATASSGDITGLSIAQLTDGKFFVGHRIDTGSYQLAGRVLTISESTISVGTTTILSTTAQTGSRQQAKALADNRVLIVHTYSASLHLYAMVVTISGTSINVNSDTKISADGSGSAGVIAPIHLLPSMQFIAAFKAGDSIQLRVFTVADTVVIPAAVHELQLNWAANWRAPFEVSELPQNQILITRLQYDATLHVQVVTITKDDVLSTTPALIQTNSVLDQGPLVQVKLSSGSILTMYTVSGYTGIRGFVMDHGISKLRSGGAAITGVAKSAARDNAVDVYIPANNVNL